MGRLITVAVCSLRQWAMDWQGNTERIIESVRRAREAGATLRVGPELEITGYGCLDHFLEGDTFLHSWEMLARIIEHPDCQDIIVDCGMPVRHRNVRYNCRVIFYNKKILLIRPKQILANDGNYRENRFFSPWTRQREVQDYYLESIVANITGQDVVPIGDAIISTKDTAIALETCHELWSANAPHIHSGLDGAEIQTNSSGSHFEIRKIQTRVDLIKGATQLSKGIYLYANCIGCDGDKLYYDGGSMIIVNGRIVAASDRFTLDDVNVVVATVDIETVRAARSDPSRGLQASQQQPFPRINVPMRLSDPKHGPSPLDCGPSPEISLKFASPQEEIAYFPALWLWDYLRRSGAAGFFIPLSGGIDSCATACIVFSMCRLVYSAIHAPDTHPATKAQVTKDCRRICAQDDDWLPESPQDICGKLFCSAFLGTENSSKETRLRAKELASKIGSYHIDVDIDVITSAIIKVFTMATSFTPKFSIWGGGNAENLALQNIQARTRMVLSYLFAQLVPTVRKRRGGGGLLVLGSANVDEQLRGYLTKYGSSADINPIGGISKTDLRSFIAYANDAFDLPLLRGFLDAPATAELLPITADFVQSDEADMGVTYAELSVFGRLRKVHQLGIWGMYEYLVTAWGRPPPATSEPSKEPSLGMSEVHQTPEAAHAIHDRALKPREVYEKVRHFFYYFNINRHKATVMTPGLHIESYTPEYMRYNLTPFLYPPLAGNWPVQKIEEHVKMMEEREEAKAKAKAKADGEN